MKKNAILEEESWNEGREIHHPAICAKSEFLLEGKRDGEVYNRLYEISKDKAARAGIQKMLDGRDPDTSQITLVDSPE